MTDFPLDPEAVEAAAKARVALLRSKVGAKTPDVYWEQISESARRAFRDEELVSIQAFLTAMGFEDLLAIDEFLSRVERWKGSDPDELREIKDLLFAWLPVNQEYMSPQRMPSFQSTVVVKRASMWRPVVRRWAFPG